MSLPDFIFWCLALLTAGSAIATAVSTQIVRSAVWLMFTLAGVAGLYFLLGFEFLGATQLLIYVGGILILVIFAVMLTAQGSFSQMPASRGHWLVVIVIGGGLLAVITSTLLSTSWEGFSASPLTKQTDTSNSDGLALTFLGSSQGEAAHPLPAVPGQIKHIVHSLFVFEIISVHLLVVLIGAAYLARARRARREAA
ncbi:MAG TPA: NADH-quinone oxidoreductase subunit J [Gemmatales bacterium]|nr:NADH-quinone oxidoreductase subunit J [Gemmatales bacterium]